LVFLPFNQLVFCILAEVISVLLLHCRDRDPSVGFSLEELPRPLHLSFLLRGDAVLNRIELPVEVSLSLREPVSLGLLQLERLLSALLGNGPRTLRQAILLLADDFGLDPLSDCYDVAIQGLDLGHQVDNFEAVVWLLRQRVAEQIQLLQKCELRDLLKKFIEISQPVVREQQSIEELELFEAINILNHVILAVDLLATEV